MRRIGLALSLQLIFLSSTVYAQVQTPQILIHAVHCLAIKGFFPSSRAAALSFGYLLDEKSYPGEKVIYTVNYASPDRSNGLVFALVLTEHEGSQIFDIQNNASFVLSKDEFHGISFVSPPLGGTWTQEHLASAIMRIEKQPRFTISVKDLLPGSTHIYCKSYTDR